MGHKDKKPQKQKTDDTKKKTSSEQGDDQGKLSDAMKNKDDDDEVTPGYQPVTPDMPTDLRCDMVAVDDDKKDSTDVARSTITANLGANNGVIEEMKAYLLMNDGEKRPININDHGVRDTATVGTIEGTAYYLFHNSTHQIVINPAESAPKKPHHTKKKHHHHH